MSSSNRGQSEVVGSLLLASVVVLAISVFGLAVVDSIETEDRQLTDVSVTVTADSVTVSHAGGEPMAAMNLAVVVDFDGRSERYNAASDGVASPFRTGDRWVIDDGLPYDGTDVGEIASVTVIAVDTNEVLYTDAEVIV